MTALTKVELYYPPEQLEIIAHSKYTLRNLPQLIHAFLRVVDGEIVWDYEEIRSEVKIKGFIERGHWQEELKDGHFVLMEPPIRFKMKHSLYVPENTQVLVYLPEQEARERLGIFSHTQRELGDKLYEKGELKKALIHYERAATITQNTENYERMLRCLRPGKRRKQIEDSIELLKNPYG